MVINKYIAPFLISCVVPLTLFAGKIDQTGLKNRMISNLDLFQNTFEVKYAPAEWKKSFVNWDLYREIENSKAQVLAKPTIKLKDFHRIVKSFFASTRDYHVDVFFHSTEAAALPIEFRSAEGRYFITWISKYLTTPLSIGDEIVQINNTPIDKVVNQFKLDEFGNPESKTDQTFAEMYFTLRLGSFGHLVPNGHIILGIKRQGAKNVTNYDFTWDYYPEEISTGPLRSMIMLGKTNPTPLKPSSFDIFKQERLSARYQAIQRARQTYEKDAFEVQECKNEHSYDLGDRNGPLPPLGRVIASDFLKTEFRAYMWETPNKKRFGYIRIPHFSLNIQASREFALIINAFEKLTDGLVIDQLNNPGGYLFSMYSLLSMLTPYPLTVPKERITITQDDVREALRFSSASEISIDEEFTDGYCVTEEFKQGIIHYFKYIIEEWNAGRSITDPTYCLGVEAIQPNPSSTYTKPILVLVNELDISCGDYFPAILQDNKRATIFGTRTAGAGGAVVRHSHPNILGIDFYSFTATIAQRKDLNPIENLGIVPDIQYDITARDLQQNYADYVIAVQKAAEGLLK